MYAVSQAAFVRLIGQIIAVILAFLLLVLWRCQKDNDYYRRKEAREEQLRRDNVAFDEDREEKPQEDKEEAIDESQSMWA